MGSAPARAVHPDRAQATAASYPTAVELVSSSDDWRAWLDEALRRVLAPAALAGAIGVAAAGCGTGGSALEAFGASPIATATHPPVAPLSPLGPTASAKPPTGGAPVASLSPLGPPRGPSPIAPPPVPIVSPSLPTPARPLPPPPRPAPMPDPPMMRGQMVAVPPNPPAPPRPARPVRPPQPVLQPIPDPIAMAGGARPAYFPPAPPPAPVIVPRPDPPSVDGEMQAVEP